LKHGYPAASRVFTASGNFLREAGETGTVSAIVFRDTGRAMKVFIPAGSQVHYCGWYRYSRGGKNDD
jgi:hypothetical protein